jgi:choline dehydrogenase
MSDHHNKEYDFVIIGGGTAGLVLAARLSEDPAVSVAVIEAGKNLVEDENILRPSLIHTLYGKPEYDWCFQTEPQVSRAFEQICIACWTDQSHKDELDGRSVSMPRGKVLGGSSAINFFMVTYASRVDLDNWEKLGNPGWNFKSLAPYYRKFEKFSQHSAKAHDALHTSDIQPSLHGTEGPIHTTIPESHWPIAEAWPPTFNNLGLRLRADSKSGTSAGGFSSIAFIDPKTATRSYSATAYYAPNATRPNLTLISDALVTKVSLSGTESNVIATGVSFKIGGKDVTVSLTKEVILSAGAFGSPHILELSGIGSAALLKAHGIQVVIENDNVGENLQDHALVPYSAEVADGELTMESLGDPEVIGKAFQEYAQHRTGHLATPSINSAAFIPYTAVLSPTEKSHAAQEIDAILENTPARNLRSGLSKQYQLIREGLLAEEETSMQLLLLKAGMPERQYSTTLPGNQESSRPGNYITILSCLQHPFSRGDVHIRSSDPNVYPAVNPRYLSHPLDLKIFSKHMFQVPKIFTTEPLASRLKGHGKVLQPGYPVLTDDNVEAFVRDNCATEHHPIATCSMLPRHEGGVVDSELRVYGTRNLRVVDASVIPLQGAFNTTTTVYALAERAADMIKEKWGLQK